MYEIPEVDLVLKKDIKVEEESTLSLPNKYILADNILIEEELEVFTSYNGIPMYTAKTKKYLKDISLTVSNILKAKMLNVRFCLVEHKIEYDLLDSDILIKYLEIPVPKINNESLEFSQSSASKEIPDLEDTEIFSSENNMQLGKEEDLIAAEDLDFEWE